MIRKNAWTYISISILCLCLLNACSQSGVPSSDVSSSLNASSVMFVSMNDTMTISNYVLVSKVQSGRTTFDYTYSASVTNSGTATTKNVTASLSSLVSSIVVISGSLTFGDVPAGATIASSGTFTVRIIRTIPFNQSNLQWDIQALSPDTDNDGVYTIVGSQGGVITTPSGGASVNVPAGDLTNRTLLSISKSESDDLPPGNITGVYDFTPDGQTYTAPITITLRYDPDTLPEDINPADLTLAYLSSEGRWVDVAGSIVDTTNHIISCQSTHFSTWTGKLPYTSAGNEVGEFNSVTAYSNGDTDFGSDEYNTYDGYGTGMKWQCVEYVNRYYWQIYGKQIRIVGRHGNDYYRNAAERGLVAYPNDGTVPPQVGDIIVSEYGLYGHVAIVREVAEDKIVVIQQNWCEGYGDNNFILRRDGNHVYPFGDGSYNIVGWVRLPLSESINNLLNSMVRIPAGSFQMGSTNLPYGYSMFSTPIHTVNLESFEISAFEVTQDQFFQVMGFNPSYFKGTNHENYPVEMVYWTHAIEFCRRLSDVTGRTFTLPSEAQWEYACRAGSTTQYCFGDDDTLLNNYAWYAGNSGNTTHPVGSKLPNAWGLYDMHGNVYEWCLDTWHTNYNGAPTDGSAWESMSSLRVTRGGSYESPWQCRSAVRSGYNGCGMNCGFRVITVQ